MNTKAVFPTRFRSRGHEGESATVPARPGGSRSIGLVWAVYVGISSIASADGAAPASQSAPPGTPCVIAQVPDAGDTSERPPPAFVHGLAGALFLASQKLDDHIPVEFGVVTLAPVPSLCITTRGLGATRLGRANPVSRDCSDASLGPHSALPAIVGSAQLVACVPAALVPHEGESVTGQLVLYAPGFRPGEFTITVKRRAQQPHPFVRTVAYVGGVIVPTLVGALIAYIAWVLRQRSTERSNAKMSWRSYVDEQRTALAEYFKKDYATARGAESGVEFAKRLRDDLISRNWWNEIPHPRRSKLSAALMRGERSALEKELVLCFPDWALEIQGKS